jgi:hypothetical protein
LKIGAGDHHVKQNEPNLERQMLHVFSLMQKQDLKKKKWT